MDVYDVPNEVALKLRGWKQKADGTYKGLKKEYLIEEIRCLEHNWAGSIKANELLSWRLERSMEEINALKKAIEEIKTYELYYYEGDYDLDDEPIDKYVPINIDEIVDDEMKALHYRNLYEELISKGKYFTEEEQKAEQDVIKKMAIEPKDNIFDYYKEENNEKI